MASRAMHRALAGAGVGGDLQVDAVFRHQQVVNTIGFSQGIAYGQDRAADPGDNGLLPFFFPWRGNGHRRRLLTWCSLVALQSGAAAADLGDLIGDLGLPGHVQVQAQLLEQLIGILGWRSAWRSSGRSAPRRRTVPERRKCGKSETGVPAGQRPPGGRDRRSRPAGPRWTLPSGSQ